MTRWVTLLLAALGGLVAGALATIALQAPAQQLAPGEEGSTADATPTPMATAPGPTMDVTGTDGGVDPASMQPDAQVLLVWTAGGLPDGLGDAVAGLPGVTDVTTVAGGTVDLAASHRADGTPVDTPADEWLIPLDALAIDPTDHAAFVSGAGRDVIVSLRDGRVVLGATSAELRRLVPGDRITTAHGTSLVVHGIVDDTLVGAAELVVTRADGAQLGIGTDRFLLVAHDGDRAALEDAVRALADAPVRVRGPGEASFLRHGDAVLPQALVKAAFGEFAYRPASDGGREVVQDPAWEAANIVSVDVPILGRVRCHRNVVKQVRGALAELSDRGLRHLVDPDGFAGCHHARRIAAGGALSRHAWGIALDLNADDNATGAVSAQDPRLVETFTRWGFTWGGFWLVPDAMHLEWAGPPTPAAAKAVAPDAAG